MDLTILVNPFDMYQQIVLIENGEIKDSMRATIDELPKCVEKFVAGGNIDKVNLLGDANYLKKIRTEISTELLEKYSSRQVPILINDKYVNL